MPAKAASRDLIPFRGSCANLWCHDPVHRATRLEQLFIGVLTARSQWCPCPNSCTAADDVFLIPQKCWRVLHEYHSGPLRGIAAINHINFLNAMLKNHPNRTPANPCSSFDNAQFGLQTYSPLCALVDTGCILQQVNHPPVYAVFSFDWSFHAWWQPCKYCFLHKKHKIYNHCYQATQQPNIDPICSSLSGIYLIRFVRLKNLRSSGNHFLRGRKQPFSPIPWGCPVAQHLGLLVVGID